MGVFKSGAWIPSVRGGPKLTAPAVHPMPFTETERRPSVSEATAEVVNQSVARFRKICLEVTGQPFTDGVHLLDAEMGFHKRVARECLDPIIAATVQAAHENPKVLERAELLVLSSPSLKPQKSCQEVHLPLLGGSTIIVETPYFLRREKTGKKKGRPRKRGKRGEAGNGCYPILVVLGIHQRVTPALASEVARLVSSGTYEAAVANLAIRGVSLDCKQVSALAQMVAQRGLSHRQWWLNKTQSGFRGIGCRGRRLAICVDGGRIRIRIPETKGRKLKSGRRSFEAPWKEPKVFVIYEFDAKGRKLPRGLVRSDASLEDAQGIFVLMVSTLRQIGAHEAREWVILGDGAPWIWNRVSELVTAVGYDPKKVTQVVDFYHAVEHLSLLASHVKTAQRKAWFIKAKRLLTRGAVKQLLLEANSLCRGRNAKKIRKLFAYFKDHEARMRYQDFRKRQIPSGSGAVESCVRRVINLRLKGNGIYWRAGNGEGVMHMRAQLLSGRWMHFIQNVLEPECFLNPENTRIRTINSYEIPGETA